VKRRTNGHFPVWLLADSPPRVWADRLENPLDERHPTRHSIWTPVCDAIQQRVYRDARKLRLNDKALVIHNAATAAAHKPQPDALLWRGPILRDMETYRDDLARECPSLIISFGQFAYEFARRCLCLPHRPAGMWSKIELGNEFRRGIEQSPSGSPLLIPLLHATIARGLFWKAHLEFCGGEASNYFEYAGEKLGSVMLKLGAEIWV
jgi:hypothetical protein